MGLHSFPMSLTVIVLLTGKELGRLVEAQS